MLRRADRRLLVDRGTILITDPPSNLDLSDAPGVLWDARVRAHRAPASRYHALKSWLTQADAGFLDLVGAPLTRPEAWLDVGLRPYQQAALSAWGRDHRGIVALPTATRRASPSRLSS
jgi:hypothetical protein